MVNIVEVVKTICEKIINLNKEMVSMDTFQSICNAKSLEIAYDDLGGSNNGFYLIGNIMRGYLYKTNANLKAGNISNVVVSSPRIQIDTTTQPFFKQITRNSFISGRYGNVCTLNIGDSNIFFGSESHNGINYTDICGYEIEATATHAAIPGTLSSYYYTMVDFNTDYFNDKE